MRTTGSWVNGQRQDTSGESVALIDPSTGLEAGSFQAATRAEVNAAVANARDGFAVWSAMEPRERGAVLTRMAALIRENSDALVELESQDTGKPYKDAHADVASAARYFEYYAGLSDKIEGTTIPLGQNYHAHTVREPYGLVAVIVPWNAPIQQAARSVAPALAVGNAVLLKPDEHTPRSAVALGELAVQAGLPAGALNVLPGPGTTTGTYLIENPEIRKISFTGSVEVGRIIAGVGARRIVPVTLELGGKSAHIIFDDVDLAAAARDAVIGVTSNNGQACSAGARVLVQETVHDEFLEHFAAEFRKLQIGPGSADLDLGPITTREQYERVLGHIANAEADGAELHVGGRPHRVEGHENGFYIEPAIITNVPSDARIIRDEVFGPVAAVQTFTTEEEAVAMANDSEYGLVAGVWTNDIARALRIARSLDVGQIFVNEYFAGGEETPFGGRRNSGYGREKGLEGLEHYAQSKTVIIRI